MITITALRWVPSFAAGNVRDHRVRWVLNEVGWPYRVELIDPKIQESVAYRRDQPFGQVPAMREPGRPTLFETGAIVLDVAQRANKLLPTDEGERSLVRSWLVAALSSVEPYLANVAEVDFFVQDEEVKRRRRPDVVRAATLRLEQLSVALGERTWLVGDDFSVADLVMSSVLRIARHTDMLAPFANLGALCGRCFARPAFERAVSDQLAEIAAHSPRDMGYDPESVPA